MGRYLTPGHVYEDGQTISGASLTEHVSDAVFKSTAISEQILKDPAALTDELLINDNGTLKKITLQVLKALSLSGLTTVPIGLIADFAGIDAPENWLLCYGQEVSRDTYSELFTVIGTIYGAGNGTSSFNVPDHRGRVSAGKDNMGGTSAARLSDSGLVGHGLIGTTLGDAGGTQSHTITAGELASHTHSASGAVNMNTSNTEAANSGLVSNGGGFQNRVIISRTNYEWGVAVSIGASGSNARHNNVQPTIVTNKIIRAL